LAGLLLILGVANTLARRSTVSVPFNVAIATTGALGALLGGVLRARRVPPTAAPGDE
jgi:hypothetical protein